MEILDWIAVAALGGMVGISELVSRYRDAPGAALRSLPAVFYGALNVAASVAALGIIHHNPSWFASRWTQILMAGVSAMAFFRTSLFIVRAGDRDVGIGPIFPGVNAERRARLPGLELINVVGVDVLTGTVTALKDQIRSASVVEPELIP